MDTFIGLSAVTVWAALLCWHDFNRRTLPNLLTMGGLAAALLLRGALGGAPALFSGVAGAAACGLLFACFNWAAPKNAKRDAPPIGGGDIKMIAAAGAIAGAGGMLNLLFYISVAGLVMAVAYLFAGLADGARVKHFANCLFNIRYDRAAHAAAIPKPDDEKSRMPFSPAVALGLLCALI